MLLGLTVFVSLINDVGTMASLPDGMIGWQSRYRVLIGLTLILAVIGGHFTNSWIKKIINNRFLTFFSLISYNLYIRYQLIAAKLFHARFPEPLTVDPHNDPQWQFLFTFFVIGLAIVIATFLTMFWERPFLLRKLKPFRETNRE